MTSPLVILRTAVLPVAFLTAATPLRAMPESGDLALGYELYAGGFHALTVKTRLSVAPERYRIDLDAKLDGLPAVFFDYQLNAKVEGRRGPDGIRPALYRSANRWRVTKSRKIELDYSPDGAVEARAEPPYDDEDRKGVPAAERLNTLDPISGVFALLLGVEKDGRCGSQIAVYDGRRRYDLVSRQIRATAIEVGNIGVYSGPAVECRIAVKKVDGAWDNRRSKDRFPKEVVAYLAPVAKGTPPVPVRLELQNAFGAIVIHLVSVAESAEPLVVNSGAALPLP